MALPAKTGTCSICRKKGSTDWHHIISQHHAKKTGRTDLLDNPDNVVELCRSCHNQTTASMVRKRLTKEKGPLPKTKKKKAIKKVVKAKRMTKKSKAALQSRFVWKNNGYTGKSLQNRIDKSMQLKGTKIEELYPPDHWLHDSKKYVARKCMIFEEQGWRWSKDGGATNETRVKDQNYRPPPPPKSF